MTIVDVLRQGKANAIPAREICEIMGIKSRQLTHEIERARRNGQPICATCSGHKRGYFIAATKQEMQEYCGRLYHRAGEIFATRRACQNTIDGLPAAAENED